MIILITTLQQKNNLYIINIAITNYSLFKLKRKKWYKYISLTIKVKMIWKQKNVYTLSFINEYHIIEIIPYSFIINLKQF